jgi:poly-gamma-glutamate synthesis protein (capsule biosynthesis protein)
MEAEKDRVVFLACGDIGPVESPLAPHTDLSRYVDLVGPVLKKADLRFAQCERTYSTRGQVQMVHQALEPGHMTRQPPKMISIFRDCGIDVVSVATNTALNWGYESYEDTLELFKEMGIQTAGGGRNLREARQPAIADVRGVTIGVLAYCSIVRDGYAAGAETPGFAPMRAHVYYEPNMRQPGRAPRVLTVPYEDDLQALCQDIADARQKVDALIVSLHWGVQDHSSNSIADYQRVVMRAAIDEGADLILGTHPHLPKGIEVYKGVCCFYGLSNFIMCTDKVGRDPKSPYGEEGKRGLMVRAEVSKSGVGRVSFLPLLIDDLLRPEVLRCDDPRFKDAVDYMEKCSAHLPHKFTVEGDEVIVS